MLHKLKFSALGGQINLYSRQTNLKLDNLEKIIWFWDTIQLNWGIPWDAPSPWKFKQKNNSTPVSQISDFSERWVFLICFDLNRVIIHSKVTIFRTNFQCIKLLLP